MECKSIWWYWDGWKITSRTGASGKRGSSAACSSWSCDHRSDRCPCSSESPPAVVKLISICLKVCQIWSSPVSLPVGAEGQVAWRRAVEVRGGGGISAQERDPPEKDSRALTRLIQMLSSSNFGQKIARLPMVKFLRTFMFDLVGASWVDSDLCGAWVLSWLLFCTV